MFTQWALQIRSKSCFLRNFVTIFVPNIQDTPRSLSSQPSTSSSGSDQRMSHIRPSSPISSGLFTLFTCSREVRSGEIPPCMQMILSSISPTHGSYQNTSQNVLHTFTLYLLLPFKFNCYKLFKEKTFVEEPIDSVYGLALVVSSEQEEVIGVFHFISKQQTNRLNVMRTTVNVITQKQVVAFGWKTAIFEQSDQVLVLAVYVSYLNGLNKIRIDVCYHKL